MTQYDTNVAAASDELVRLANEGKRVPALEAEIERLTKERDQIKSEASELAGDLRRTMAENERLRAALDRRIVNYREQERDFVSRSLDGPAESVRHKAEALEALGAELNGAEQLAGK